MPAPTSATQAAAKEAAAAEAGRRDEETIRYRAVLDEVMGMALNLARIVHNRAQARAAEPDAPDPTPAFDRIARTVRRTVMLSRKLGEPVSPARPGPGRDTAGRAKPAPAKPLSKMTDAELDELIEAEGLDRLDDDALEALEDRPIGELIAELARAAGTPPRAVPAAAAHSAPRNTPRNTQAWQPGAPPDSDASPGPKPPPSRTGPGPPR